MVHSTLLAAAGRAKLETFDQNKMAPVSFAGGVAFVRFSCLIMAVACFSLRLDGQVVHC